MIPRIKHILYASDLSKNSMPALAWAMMMSQQHDAKVTFIHVKEEVSPHSTSAIRSFMGEAQWEKMINEWENDANSEIEARIRKFCESASVDMKDCPAVPWDTVIATGVPVESILHEATKRNCDLIVMGTHGAGIFKNAVIGSTARRVVRHSRIPVIVIPLGKDQAPASADPII